MKITHVTCTVLEEGSGISDEVSVPVDKFIELLGNDYIPAPDPVDPGDQGGDPDSGQSPPPGDWTQMYRVKDGEKVVLRQVKAVHDAGLELEIYPFGDNTKSEYRLIFREGEPFMGAPDRVKLFDGSYAVAVMPGVNGVLDLPLSHQLYALKVDCGKV